MVPSEPGGTPTPDNWTPWATPTDAPPASTEPTAVEPVADVPVADAPVTAVAAPPPPLPESTRGRPASAVAPVTTGRADTPSTFSVGGLMVAIGAAIAIGGTFLDTYKVTVGIQSLESVNFTSTYFDADRGKVVAGSGAAVLLLALIGLLRVGDHVVPAIVAGLGGAVILGLAIYDRIDLDNFLDDKRQQIQAQASRSLFHVSFGPALYVCMGGGVIIMIGAVMAARRN